MIELFISYSQLDRDKVDILERELKDHKLFKPLIIAANREPLKPLAKKVTDGIKSAEIIIPILTKQSIATQWINQEIGYATAIDKKIMPIVDVKIIDDLKGFIHKQIDLPYGYMSHVGKNIETKNFTKAARNLISDLEETFNKKNAVSKPKKTGFDGTLERFDIFTNEQKNIKEKHDFLESAEGLQLAKKEVLTLLTDAKDKLDILSAKNIPFGVKYDFNSLELKFILRGHSCSFEYTQNYSDKIKAKRILRLKLWKGNLDLNGNAFSYDGWEPPIVKSTFTFVFERNDDSTTSWILTSDGRNYSSDEISNIAFNWIIERYQEFIKKSR